MDRDHRKIAAASVLTIGAAYIGYLLLFNTDEEEEGGHEMPDEDVTAEQIAEELNIGGSTVPEESADETADLGLHKMRLADSVKTGNLLSVKNLLWEIDVNTYLEGTKTPAYIASLYGRIDVLRYLYSHNADLKHVRDDSSGWTCAHAAASKGHVRCLEFIIQVGVDVTQPSHVDGTTPLYCAKEAGQSEVVEILKKIRDEKLFQYARFGNIEGMQSCLNDGSNVNCCPFGSQSSAYIAAYCGELHSIAFLYDKGADLTLADKDGFSCAHAAASRGHLEILRFLFETANINLTVKTKSGKTTIHLAAENSHDHVVQYIAPHFCEIHQGAGATGGSSVFDAEGSTVSSTLFEKESSIPDSVDKQFHSTPPLSEQTEGSNVAWPKKL